MTKRRIVTLGLLTVVAFVTLIAVGPIAQMSKVSANNSRVCSIATIAGDWVFKTDGFYTQTGMVDGNSLGIFHVQNDGTLKGKYDWQGVGGFYPGTNYVGTASVNLDCTGTFSFHDVGSDQIVVQSIVIARSGREILGMMQDPTLDVGTFGAIRMREDY